jgi:hypothetical protein
MKNAKVTDFGLSWLTHGENITHITTNVKGTVGNLDPKWVFSYFFLNNISWSNNHMIMCVIDYID